MPDVILAFWPFAQGQLIYVRINSHEPADRNEFLHQRDVVTFLACQEDPAVNFKSIWPALLVFLFLNTFASASAIAITGTASQGFAITTGDFQIQGPGLSLIQGAPDGPSFIGSCALGSMCNLSFTIGSTAQFCTYCTGFSSGSVGGAVVQFLDPSLTFTASALYTGQSNISVPLTFSGTIVGYQLVNCTDGVDCSLGPKEFTLHISGTGTANFSMLETGLIEGVNASFTGSVSVVPEPASLVLMGSGLAGIALARRRQRKIRAS